MEEMEELVDEFGQTTRRGLLKTAAGALTGAALLGSSVSSASAGVHRLLANPRLSGIKSITIANFGGTTNEGMLETFGKLFTERTRIKIATTFSDYGKFQAQLKTKKVQWSWIDADGWLPFGLGKDLRPIDLKALGVTRSQMLNPQRNVLKNGIASYHTAYAIGYRTDRDGPHPKSWKEFFDPSAVPGKRSLYNWPYGMVEAALLADGVPFNKLYPLDLDRAFAKIRSIKSDLIFWNTGAEAQQQLVSQSADFVAVWNNRVGYLGRSGLPVAIEWAQNLPLVNYHIIPKYDPKWPATVELIKAALDPKVQASLALLTGLSPTRKEAFALVSPSMKPWLSTNPANARKAAGHLNDVWWGANMDRVTKKWYEFVGTL